MEFSPERLEGEGSLQAGTLTAPAMPVKYSLVIRRIANRTRPGLPPPPPRLEGRGTVTSLSGTELEDGRYILTTADGRGVRLQKLGPDWIIVAPP